MKKSLLCLTVFLLALFGAFSSNTARASHAAGGEISYKWLHDSTYMVYFKFYRDCGGIPEPATQTVCYANTCNSQQGSLTLNKLVGSLPVANGGSGTNGDEVNIGCPGFCTTCSPPNPNPPCVNGNQLLPGYREWWYGDSVTLNSRCNYWRFWTAVSARNTGVTNIQSGANLYVEATLNNLDANVSTTSLGPQSSAYFTIKPVPYVCVNQPYCYNMGAVDNDNDSLVFQMIQPRTASGNCGATPGESNVNFISGVFNLNTNPFATGNSFTLDPATGQICFTPTQQQIANVAILVKEYRAGVLVGTTMRDIQVIALPCTNQQPSAPQVNSTLVGVTLNNGRIEGCTGQHINFCFDIKSPDTMAVLVPRDNHTFAAPGSGLTYAGYGTDSVRGCFDWTPGPFDTGLRQLTIVIKDSTCTPPGIPISQSFNIKLYIYPTATILKDTALCQGDSVRLLAIGGSQFTWSVLPGGSPLSTLSCTTCKNPVAKPTKTTNYVVTTNLQSVCNKNKDTVTITVPESPDFNAGPDTTTCVNSSLQLNINLVPKPGTTYNTTWTPATGLSAANIPNPIASPKGDITYYVTVVPGGLNQCSKRDTLNVKVLKGFTIPNVDTAICDGKSVTVRGTGDSHGGASYTYTWTALPAATAGISSTSILTPTLTPTFIGTTTYTVKASYPGCVDSVHQLKVDLQPPPTVTLPAGRILCYGDTAHLNSKVTPSYPGYIYTWTPGGLLSSNNTPNTIFSAQATTTLTLKVNTTAGCNGQAQVTETVIPSNYLDGFVSKDTAICPGYTVKLKVGGPTVKSFVWRPALYLSDTTANEPISTPIVSTLYSVYAIDTTGCHDTASVLVDVKPAATIFLPDSVTLYPGDSIQFQPIANGSNALYYSWFPPQGLNYTNIANPVAMPTVNTRYHVTGITEFGCMTKDSVDVFVSPLSLAGLPNAFTPGGGTNNLFRVSHEGLMGLNYFRIYNRWGTLVFETNKLNEGWDGTYKGEPQPMGVYVYMFEAVMPGGKKMTQQGNVTLLR